MATPLRTLIGMARVARGWEYGYFAGLLVLTGLALASGRIGIPRLLAGYMALLIVLMCAAGLFIVDNVRTRLERTPAHLR